MTAPESAGPIEPLRMRKVEEIIQGLCDRDGGIRTMRRDHVDMAWSEVVVAFAVMGIITFLWLL
jgi:hypothetical protein